MNVLQRQSFLGSSSGQTLGGLTVGLVGLGGGGSHVAQQLAHAGVGGYVLVDPDIITLTNLNRLVGAIYKDAEEGTQKVEIAARLIRGIAPNTRIQKFASAWQEASDALKDCDVVIGGLDSVRAKDELDAFCRRFLIPYIDMGMDVNRLSERAYLISGQVVMTSPGHPCLRCLGIVTEEGLKSEANNYGAAGSMPQVVWPNGVLASTAVGLCMQLITPWHGTSSGSAFLEYDGNTNTLKPAHILQVQRQRKCRHYDEHEVGDPLFDIRKWQWNPPTVDTPQKPTPTKKSKLRSWLNSLFGGRK